MGTCDSLFFLHTFLETRAWKASRKNTEPPVLFMYTVQYEDGSQEKIEVSLGQDVANWLTATPRSLSRAGLAWTSPLEGKNESMAVYQMQWNNPHPKKAIKSIDLSYGPDGNRWGAPVLLGITAAQVQE